ncbi:hypothetical protein POJ06DRAFT_260592 [Lipomyces tetrasporus]|uniref:Dpy-30 domain-containing protein n=1 Tax=Lipomyces tetrasporus TaxID=54092 RepID=A0AAD7VQC3_9ASCO|nr:uncharacterized protein POJ06DRAFT_260592 [Lipomyces tetrasporus]KAJ8097973.1 hypothetical protein POJ06DRAFT_260592 [Lipomyces tetrasporus]
MTGPQLSGILAPQSPAPEAKGQDQVATEHGTESQEILDTSLERQTVSESITSESIRSAAVESGNPSVAESAPAPPIPELSSPPKPDVEMKDATPPLSMAIQGKRREDTVDEEDDTEDERPVLPLSKNLPDPETNTPISAELPNLLTGTSVVGKSRESSLEPKRKQQKTSHTITDDEVEAGMRNGTAAAGGNAVNAVEDKNKPMRGGAPTRRYLNELITPALLDGVKLVAREQPENPLEVLGKYLLARSKNVPTKSKSSVKPKPSK